jgi:hypothetical protein
VSCALPLAFDSFGITADDNVAPGNFDGIGDSYSENALALQGLTPGSTLSHAGLEFTWPDVPAGQPDNVAANGQLITVSGSGDTLAVIGADNGAFLAPAGTVYYTDGSSSPFTAQLGRWITADPGRIVQTPYYNSQRGRVQRNAYLYYGAAPIDPARTVAAVQLPKVGGPLGTAVKMHVFAIAVGNSA